MNFDVEHEDVFMKLFMQSLTDDAREWYKSLPDSSIRYIQDFKRIFKDQYGDHSDTKFALHELTNIKKGHNEEVSSFNNRFIKLLKKIPPHLKLTDHVYYFLL